MLLSPLRGNILGNGLLWTSERRVVVQKHYRIEILFASLLYTSNDNTVSFEIPVQKPYFIIIVEKMFSSGIFA